MSRPMTLHPLQITAMLRARQRCRYVVMHSRWAWGRQRQSALALLQDHGAVLALADPAGVGRDVMTLDH
eukprot:5289608-Pleurochrysis_carterae.AAC.5